MGGVLKLGFFSLVPRDKNYLGYAFKDIPLRVIRDKGIETTRDLNVQITDLNGGYKHFKLNNGRGDSFKISILIHKNDTVKGVKHVEKSLVNVPSNVIDTTKNTVIHGGISQDLEDGSNISYDIPQDVTSPSRLNYTLFKDYTVISTLNYFMNRLIPFYVKSDIIGVNSNDLYLITENKSRKQDYKDYVVWELVFTRYVAVKYAKFTNTNRGVQAALKKVKSAKAKAVAAKLTPKQKLAKCNPVLLRYSKTKKVTACIKVLQTVLYSEGCLAKNQIDGWYGDVTRKAVHKYQTKYKTKYGLKPNGFINTATFNALIGKGKLVKTTKVQIGSTRIIKSNTKGIIK